MACGTPVVGSNIGGITDIIKDGETGFLAQPENPKDIAKKIIELLSNEKTRQRVSDNGLKMITEKFSWDIVTKLFTNIYQRLE